MTTTEKLTRALKRRRGVYLVACIEQYLLKSHEDIGIVLDQQDTRHRPVPTLLMRNAHGLFVFRNLSFCSATSFYFRFPRKLPVAGEVPFDYIRTRFRAGAVASLTLGSMTTLSAIRSATAETFRARSVSTGEHK